MHFTTGVSPNQLRAWNARPVLQMMQHMPGGNVAPSVTCEMDMAQD